MHAVQVITAFVLCEVIFVVAQSDGDVRLSGDFPCHPFQGRVEIYHQDTNQWGTICDNDWDIADASVVCRQLNFDSATAAPGSAFFGPGDESMPIFLNIVHCLGDEEDVLQCPMSVWNNNSCNHGQDAGVICANDVKEGAVRLVAGSTYNTGRVEIFHDDSWGTICTDDWDLDDAKVVCRELGFGAANTTGSSSSLGAGVGDVGQPIHLSGVGCNGTEGYLADCRSLGWGNHSCQHVHDAGVICGEEEGGEGDLRIMGDRTNTQGRVEIFHANRWGTLSDPMQTWDIRDATVACQQMGFADAASAINSPYFGESRVDQPNYYTGNIGLRCHGNETKLTDCFSWLDNVCYYAPFSDISIVCLNAVNEDDLRLTDSVDLNSGRVEIYHGGEWGTICYAYDWTKEEGQVICNQLGLYDVVGTYPNGLGWGPILLSGVDCVGNEKSIAECDHDEWGKNDCTHSDDLVISCQTSPNSPLPTEATTTSTTEATTESSGRNNSALISTLAIVGALVIVVIA